MQKIGITGGIGSGKTVVSKVFNKMYQIPVFNADTIAKKLMTEDENLKKQIISILGENSYLNSGQLNKKYIAKKIFNNNQNLTHINSIVHTKVRERFNQWSQQQKTPYVLHEAAITIESGFFGQLNKLISVNAPEKTRIQRVLERDNLSKEQILQRIKQQLSDDKRSRFADFIITNDNEHSIISQVKTIHEKILSHG